MPICGRSGDAVDRHFLLASWTSPPGVRLAQRVPVRIALDYVPPDIGLVSGRTATVEVLPHDASLSGVERARRQQPVTAGGGE